MKPLFTFLQFNDVHVTEKLIGYPGAKARFQWLANQITSKSFSPNPDFIISLGDQIRGDDSKSVYEDTKTFSSMIKDFPCPFYPLMGNHENIQQEGSKNLSTSLKSLFLLSPIIHFFMKAFALSCSIIQAQPSS